MPIHKNENWQISNGIRSCNTQRKGNGWCWTVRRITRKLFQFIQTSHLPWNKEEECQTGDRVATSLFISLCEVMADDQHSVLRRTIKSVERKKNVLKEENNKQCVTYLLLRPGLIDS